MPPSAITPTPSMGHVVSTNNVWVIASFHRVKVCRLTGATDKGDTELYLPTTITEDKTPVRKPRPAREQEANFTPCSFQRSPKVQSKLSKQTTIVAINGFRFWQRRGQPKARNLTFFKRLQMLTNSNNIERCDIHWDAYSKLNQVSL